MPLHALCAALGLALLAGCADQADPAAAPASAAAAASAPASAAASAPASAPAAAASADAPPAQADLSLKMQAYIGCYNGIDGRAHESISRYTSWVKDMQAGPTGKERIVYGLYRLDDSAVQQCQQNVAATLAKPPAMDTLDKAAQAYVAALQTLHTRVSEAEPYYSREDYKDDGFAKGQQMHAPLAEAMDAFGRASVAFSDALEAENDQIMAAELARVEQAEGKTLRYWRMATMIEAKRLVNLAAEDRFDAAQASEQLERFEETADHMRDYAKTHADEQPTLWSTFESPVEAFLVAAKERVRRVRDQTPYSQGERAIMQTAGGSGAWMIEGSPAKLVRAYNDMVTASNRLSD